MTTSGAHPTAQILDSAVALARAEVRLLWSHVRQIGARVGVALGLTWFSMLLTQIALLMLAASPIIGASYGSTVVIASTAPALIFAAVAWGICIKKWLALTEERAPAQHSALELSGKELEGR